LYFAAQEGLVIICSSAGFFSFISAGSGSVLDFPGVFFGGGFPRHTTKLKISNPKDI
jgi:hypothetical protein